MKHRRVRPPKEIEEISDKLIDDGPFETKQKLLMFAAAIGVQKGERSSFSSSDVAIRWDIFERNNDDTFIYALAISETGGIEILSKKGDESGDFILIFEEYAYAGIQHLKKHVLNSPNDALDEVISLIMSMRRRDEDAPSGLEGLTQEDLNVLGL